MVAEEARAARIADIGHRANALRRAGFYSADEVAWLAEYVRAPTTVLIDVEVLLANAERLVKENARVQGV